MPALKLLEILGTIGSPIQPSQPARRPFPITGEVEQPDIQLKQGDILREIGKSGVLKKDKDGYYAENIITGDTTPIYRSKKEAMLDYLDTLDVEAA